MSTSLLTAPGLLGVTITVAVTTIDDAIWLLSYITATGTAELRWSTWARICHGISFVLTLETLAVASVIVAWIIEKSTIGSSASEVNMDKSNESASIILGVIAASFCWLLAILFYIKKLLKHRRREVQQREHSQLTTASDSATNSYDAIPVEEVSGSSESPQPDVTNNLSCTSIATVVSLTILGALDELSYFPALLIGNIFTPYEICLGTLLAALLVLGVITCCLTRCQPLVDILDRIPIYVVIAVFATVLTVEVLYDILTR